MDRRSRTAWWCPPRPRLGGRGWPRRRPPQFDPARLRRTVRNIAEGLRVVGFDAGDRRGDAASGKRFGELVEQCDQHIACGRGDGGVGRRPSLRCGVECVRARAVLDRIEGVVDGQVRHRVHTRFVKRVVGGSEAGNDGGLAGVRVPRGDRVRLMGVRRRADRGEYRQRDEHDETCPTHLSPFVRSWSEAPSSAGCVSGGPLVAASLGRRGIRSVYFRCIRARRRSSRRGNARTDTGASRAGSCPRIPSWRPRSSGPGSIPICSLSDCRAWR